MSGLINSTGSRSGIIGPKTFADTPAFSATASYTNIPLNTPTAMTLSSARFDVGSNISGNTFTAPVTGKYLFTYMFYFINLDDAHTSLDVYILTSLKQYQQTFKPSVMFSADASFSVSSSIIADMDAGDTTVINVHVAGGGATSDLHADSQVSGCLLY